MLLIVRIWFMFPYYCMSILIAFTMLIIVCNAAKLLYHSSYFRVQKFDLNLNFKTNRPMKNLMKYFLLSKKI